MVVYPIEGANHNKKLDHMFFMSGRNKGLVSDDKVRRKVVSRLSMTFESHDRPDRPAHEIGYVHTPEGRKRLIARHAVDLVVLSGHKPPKVLLIRRHYPPGKGLWALAGGFVEQDERLRAAALRECDEETGLVSAVRRELELSDDELLARVIRLGKWRVARPFDIRCTSWLRKPVQLCEDVTLSPGDLMAVTTLPFMLVVPTLKQSMLRAGDDADDAQVFPVSLIGRRKLGIKDHYEILRTAVELTEAA